MANHIREITQKKQDSRFRYGMSWADRSKVETYVYRNPVGHRISFIMPKTAMGRGFRVVDPNMEDQTEESLPWNNELWEFLRPEWPKAIRAMGVSEGFGKALVLLVSPEAEPGSEDPTEASLQNTLNAEQDPSSKSSEDMKQLVLRYFSPFDYESDYHDDGSLKYIKATMKVKGTLEARTIIYEWNTPEQLEFAYEINLRPTEVVGQGTSKLEPIVDQMYSWNVLDANATYFAIRVGGGLLIYKLTESHLDDENWMETNVFSNLRMLDSARSAMFIPLPDAEGMPSPELDIASGEQIDFLAIKKLLMDSIAFAYGYPTEEFLGNETGLRSGKTNESKSSGYSQELQLDFDDFIHWLVDRFNQIYSFASEEVEYGISWEKRVQQSEEDKNNSDKTKSETLSNLLSAGVSFDSAITFLGLEGLEQDEEKLKMQEEMRANNPFMQGEDGETNDKTNSGNGMNPDPTISQLKQNT